MNEKQITLSETNDESFYIGLIDFARIHSVTGILAAVNKKHNLGFPEEYARQMDTYMYPSVSISVTWDNVYSEISLASVSEKTLLSKNLFKRS